MKFGKQLRQIVLGSLPEWQPKFIAYKALKQRIEPRQDRNGNGRAKVRTKAIQPVVINATMSAEESKMLESKGVQGQGKVFFEVLRNEMEKVNEFYLDKEEDCIIRYDLLASKVKDFLTGEAPTRSEVVSLKQMLIDLHAELVLLDNFSTVNYTGFRKILKKHDKKTGLNVRKLYMKAVLVTPFFRSTTVPKLLKNIEARMQELDSLTRFRKTDLQVHEIPVRPRAQISSESSLYKLHDDMERSPGSEKGFPMLAEALRHTNNITCGELGINQNFLNAVSTASYFSILATKKYSVGFFVLHPQDKVQFFSRSGIAIAKLMHGDATLREWKCEASGEEGNMELEEVQGLKNHAPGRAFSFNTSASAHEWYADGVCAILYVFSPSYTPAEPMYKYDVAEKPGANSEKFYVAKKTSEKYEFTAVHC